MGKNKILFGLDLTHGGSDDKNDIWNLLFYVPVSGVGHESITEDLRRTISNQSSDVYIPNNAFVIYDIAGSCEKVLQCRLFFYGNAKSRKQFDDLEISTNHFIEQTNLNRFYLESSGYPDAFTS